MNQHALLESTYRLNVARQIDEICDDYEARLLECEDIELIEYIDRIEEPHREQLCVELVHVRLEHSDATSEEDSIDSILSKLPEEIRESVRKRLETSAKKPKSHSPNSPTKVDCLVDDATVPEIPGFEVGQRVAEGGMGIIWKAKDLTLGRTVAVKVIKAKAARDPAFVQRFIDEVKIAGQLSHPFIVPIHALGQLADGRHYFTMKLVEGQTLSSLIRQFDERDSDAPGPHLELLLIFQKVCETMAFAHRKGILHRDLKPHNIMVGRHGEVQVMDWGLAGTLNSPRVHSSSEPKRSSIVHFSGPEKAALTRMGDILGTLAYMAPEQARGLNSGLDGRTDVFSLGAILCEILTGKPPYSSSDPTEVEHAAVSGDLEECLNRLENCHVDPQLIAIAKCCLSVQKRDRPGNAGIVAEMISGYLNSVEERAREERLEIERLQVQKREDANRRVLRRRYAAIAGLLLVFLGALSTHTWHQHRSRQERASSAIEETKSLISTGDYSNAKARLTSAKTEFGSTDEFESLQAALHLAGQLDTIRNDYFSWHDGWFDCFTAIEQYQIAFQEHQFPVELLSSTTADLTPFVQAVERSPVRERILNALDDWAWLAHREAQRSEMPQRDDYFSFRNNLLEIAIRSDAPSSIRSKLRNHQMWDYPQSLVEIARELDPSTLAPEQLVLTAKLLPADDRRNLLLRSQRVW
ncbi:MAG: serine/threonine protein kinase, partial [Planctomycetaceae bacterium]|nr:serine/threonine protein kinase [Planctomycetaceae bacterium]